MCGRNFSWFLIFFILLTKLEHHLAGISIVLGVESVIASTPSILDKRIGGLGITKQILLHIAVDFL